MMNFIPCDKDHDSEHVYCNIEEVTSTSLQLVFYKNKFQLIEIGGKELVMMRDKERNIALN